MAVFLLLVNRANRSLKLGFSPLPCSVERTNKKTTGNLWLGCSESHRVVPFNADEVG